MKHHIQVYRLSSDPHIKELFRSLPTNIQSTIKRRDEISALDNGLSIDEYLYLISNLLNES